MVKPLSIISARRLKKMLNEGKQQLQESIEHVRNKRKQKKNEYYTFPTQAYKNNKQAKSHFKTIPKTLCYFHHFFSKTIIPGILWTRTKDYE
jgi:hypothetical protein